MKRLLVMLLMALSCSMLYGLPDRTEFPSVIIFHDGEKQDTLNEIDQLIEKVREKVGQYLEIAVPKRELYIYGNQKQMQRQKHPIVSTFIKLDWYIGDNIGERALIVSPNTKVKVHSYKSIINAIPHEYIHTVVFSINPKCPLWLNEGLALYLSNRQKVSTSTAKIPPIKIFRSSNSLYFEKNNGYVYADKFIEYVEDAYGHGKVLELLQKGDYEKVLEKPLETVYSEWVEFLKRRYP